MSILAILGSLSGGSAARLIAGVGVVGVTAVGTGAVASTALYTDSGDVSANAFSSGTLDISTGTTSAWLTLATMAPGAKVVAPLTVTNGGTLEMRYAVTSTSTENTLAGQLNLTIKTGITAGNCTADNFASAGTTVYGADDLGSTAGLNVIGNPAQGGQSGDRTLAAGTSEVLCAQVQLPLGTGNTFQGTSTTATFALAAEQTANNA